MKKQNIILISSVFLIAVFVLGSYFYKLQQEKKMSFLAQENVSTFIRDYSVISGSDDAKVYIVEFFDPACETCRVFHPFVKKLMAANPGKIKHVSRYAPFHSGSDLVVAMLEAARKQGKYEETLEIMFKYQPQWASHHNPQPQLLWKYLREASLDLDQLKADMSEPEIARRIQQDIADAKALNVSKTPEFFINGKPLPSFGYQQLLYMVETEIKTFYD